MRVKLMMHYAGTFFLSCLILVVINVLYMRSFVYQEGNLYRYEPAELFQRVSDDIASSPSGGFKPKASLVRDLEEQAIGLQLLSEDLEEVYRLNAPESVSKHYTAVTLVDLYESEEKTTWVESISIDGKPYTAVLFMDPQKIKRTLYTYEVNQVSMAYNSFWLIGMNLFVLLMLSYMYTYNVSRPIHRVIQRVMALAEGTYEQVGPAKGVYKSVDEAIDQLASQLDAAKQEQQQAEITREEWISNLSHDIKTPLTAIVGYGELIGDLAYPLTEAEREHYSKVIQDKGSYIKSLLADLNLAARLKHNHLRLKCDSVNITDFIRRELIDFMNDASTRFSEDGGNNGPVVGGTMPQVTFTHAEDTLMTEMDQHLFRRALTNLLHNAYVHNERAVTLQVHVEPTGSDGILLTIDDDGIGVPDAELSKIFTRYYRGTHTNAHSEGSGLGLAISNDIIVAHGGHIEASRSTRGGLRLTVHLRRIT